MVFLSYDIRKTFKSKENSYKTLLKMPYKNIH